jgi:hypothetical protein
MKKSEKKILAAFNRLESSAQETLLAFAEFLASRNANENHPVQVPEPRIIQRPDNESVVAAIKRLSASYPMLDKPQLLNESSAIMTKHVMQGVKAEVAVDELEMLFLRFYEELLEQSTNSSQ